MAMGSHFICNICGSPAEFHPQGDWREVPTCQICGSSVRARHIAHCLSLAMFGRCEPLASVCRKDITGIGLSDAGPLAAALEQAFDYTNTFYHMQPRLDICRPEAAWSERAGFIISSDVFEHVPNPVSMAFCGAYDVLRPDGLLVLTVPFDTRPTTTEHFSEVIRFNTVELDGEWMLVGKTSDGSLQVHRNLIFHRGPGTTVEMRFFGLQDLIANLREAGFRDIQVHDEDVPESGIFLAHHGGLPITAWKRPECPVA